MCLPAARLQPRMGSVGSIWPHSPRWVALTAPAILLMAVGIFRGWWKMPGTKPAEQTILVWSWEEVTLRHEGLQGDTLLSMASVLVGLQTGWAMLCCIFCHTFLQKSRLAASRWLSCGEWWCYSVNLKRPLWFVLTQATLGFGNVCKDSLRGSVLNLGLVTLIMWAFGLW